MSTPWLCTRPCSQLGCPHRRPTFSSLYSETVQPLSRGAVPQGTSVQWPPSIVPPSPFPRGPAQTSQLEAVTPPGKGAPQRWSHRHPPGPLAHGGTPGEWLSLREQVPEDHATTQEPNVSTECWGRVLALETHGTHATFSTSSPRPWSPSKAKVVTHLSRKSPSTKLFLTHHPTPPTSPTQGRRATGTSAAPTLQRRTWGSNGKEYHSLRTEPETLRLRQGPCPGARGPRPGSVGSTQAQRAEIVDIIWCPEGAQTRTDSDRPGLGPGPTAHLLFPSLSLSFLSTSHGRYLRWHPHQGLVESVREANVPSRANGTRQCPTKAPSHSCGLRTSRPAEPFLARKPGRSCPYPCPQRKPLGGLAHPDLLPPAPCASQLLASNGSKLKPSFSPCLTKDPTSGQEGPAESPNTSCGAQTR